MLTAISESKQQKVAARITEKAEGPFYCPFCQAEVILRKGYIKTHHFAHLPESDCQYKGESPLHLSTKLDIYHNLCQELNGRVNTLELEKPLGKVRPDIFVGGRKKNIAIEIQASSISPQELLKRTSLYFKMKIYVLWVVPLDKKRMLEYHPEATNGRIKPFRLRSYEEVLQHLYFRNLILWDISRTFPPGFIILALENTWTDGASFYSHHWGGLLRFEPRKLKQTRKVRKIISGLKLGDFSPSFAPAFTLAGKNLSLPPRFILNYDWRKQNPTGTK